MKIERESIFFFFPPFLFVLTLSLVYELGTKAKLALKLV